jgi:hypothetical protein
MTSSENNAAHNLKVFGLSKSIISDHNHNSMTLFLNTMSKTNQFVMANKATLYAERNVLKTILRPVAINEASALIDSVMLDQQDIGQQHGLAFQPKEMDLYILSDKERTLTETKQKLDAFGIETSAICHHPTHKKPYIGMHISDTDPADFIKNVCHAVTAEACTL